MHSCMVACMSWKQLHPVVLFSVAYYLKNNFLFFTKYLTSFTTQRIFSFKEIQALRYNIRVHLMLN